MLVFWPHKKVPKKPTFGSPLWTQTIPDCDSIPAIIAKCISEIDDRGRKIKGLYRVSGVKSKVDKLCSSLEHGSVDNVNLSDIHPNIIANVLKLYLRQLPEPLMTHRLYPEFIRVAKQFPASPILDKNKRQIDGENGVHENNSCNDVPDNNSDFSCIELQEIHQLVNLVSRLPKINYLTLAYLMHHLKRISDKSNINCMTSRNLGIVFGPTLMTGGDGLATLVDTVHHTRVVELLITYAHQIFGSPFSVDNLGRIVGFADPRDWDTESDSGEGPQDEDDDEENNVNLQNRELIHQFLTKSPLSPPPLCTSDYNLLRRKSRDHIDLRPGKSMEFLPHTSSGHPSGHSSGPVSSDRSQCLWDDPFYDNLPANYKENRSRSMHENSNNTITLAGQKIIVKSMSRPSLHPISFSQFDQEDDEDELDREYLPFSPSPLSPSASTSNYHQLAARSLSPSKSLSSTEVPAVLSQGRSSRSSNTGQSDQSCNSSGYVTATYSSPGSKVSVATNRPVNSSHRSSLKKHQRKDNRPQNDQKVEKEVIVAVNQSFGSTNSFSSSSQSTLASSDMSDHQINHSTSPISSSSQHHYDVVTDEEGDASNFLIIKQKQSLRQHPTQQKQSVDYSNADGKDQLQNDLQSLRASHKENSVLKEPEPVVSQTSATKVSINELRRQFFTSQSGGVTNDVRNDLANIEQNRIEQNNSHMNPISRSVTSVQFSSNPITQSSSDVTVPLPEETPQAPLRLKRASTGIHLNVRFSKQVSTAGHMSPTGKWISHTVSTPTKCVKWPTQVHWDVRRKSKDDSDFVSRRKEVTSTLKHSSSLAQTLDRKTAQAKSTTSLSTTQVNNNNNNDIHDDKMHELLKNHPLAAYASIRNNSKDSNDSISRSRSAHTVSFVPAPDVEHERRPEFV